eukprot:1153434-Pelagomonas_calceolata.AAC.2
MLYSSTHGKSWGADGHVHAHVWVNSAACLAMYPANSFFTASHALFVKVFLGLTSEQCPSSPENGGSPCTFILLPFFDNLRPPSKPLAPPPPWLPLTVQQLLPLLLERQPNLRVPVSQALGVWTAQLVAAAGAGQVSVAQSSQVCALSPAHPCITQ